MKKLLATLLLVSRLSLGDTTITSLPSVAPASVGSSDVLPFVNLALNQTSKIKLSELLSIPSLQSPTFTGTVGAATSIDTPAFINSAASNTRISAHSGYSLLFNNGSGDVAALGTAGNWTFGGVSNTGYPVGIISSSATTGNPEAGPSLFLKNSDSTVSNRIGLLFANSTGAVVGAVTSEAVNQNSSGTATGKLYFAVRNAGSMNDQMTLNASGNVALLSGSLSFSTSGQGIVGTTSNDNAATGNVGQYVQTVGADSAWSTGTGDYGDLGSISLTAGDWDVTGISMFYNSNSAGLSASILGIGLVSGNSSSGLVYGQNTTYQTGVTSAGYTVTLDVPAYRISLATTTIVYLKGSLSYGGGTPHIGGYRISARRVR